MEETSFISEALGIIANYWWIGAVALLSTSSMFRVILAFFIGAYVAQDNPELMLVIMENMEVFKQNIIEAFNFTKQ